MDPNEQPPPVANTPDAPDAETKEKIRLRRLAKLGGSGSSSSSPKPEASSSTTSPQAETPSEGASTSAAPVPAVSIPALQPTPTAPTNPFQQLATMSRSSTTPSTPPATDSNKRPASALDSSRGSTASAPPRKQPSTQQGEALEDFADRVLSHIFRFTVDPSRRTDSHGHNLRFLPGVSVELAKSGEPLKLSAAILDEAIQEVCTTLWPTDKPLMAYLLPCWKRVVRTLSAVKDNQAKRKEVLQEAKRLCMSSCLFALTLPALYGRDPNPQHDSLAPYLLRGLDNEEGVCLDFIKEAIARFPEADEDAYERLFVDAMVKLSTDLGKLTMNDNYKPYMEVMLTYSKFPPLLSALAKHPTFNMAQSAPGIERHTLLGPFFRLSPLQAEVTRTYFAGPRSLDRGRVAQSQDASRVVLRAHQDQLFTIANAFIRADSETRNKTLDWFAYIMNVNHKRRAIQVDPKEVATDAFMMNVTVILDRFCDPFMDTSFSKVDRIDVEYFRRAPRVDIKDETKINADDAKATAYYDTKVGGTSNFISEVFFLALAAHHYGSEAANTKLKNMDREIKYFESQLRRMEAERPNVANVPMQAARLEDLINKYTQTLENAMCMKFAIEGVLLDEKMQSQSLRFMRYVAVWLLRVASRTDYTPEKDLHLPLPDAQSEAFACLPEYALQNIVDNFKFTFRYLPQIMPSAVGNEMIALAVAFLHSSSYIKNPYLKAALVTLLFSGTWPFHHLKKGVLGDQLMGTKFANDYLLHALLKFYIECEQSGVSSAFYDKFNIRYEIFQIIKCVWPNDVYKQQLTRESKVNRPFFVQFVNLLMNDATFVLDEALGKFPKIHTLQIDLREKQGLTQDQRTKMEEELATLENQATSYMQLANETLEMMNLFTTTLVEAFTMPEIVTRLASMLNYNLDTLAGNKMSQLKVDDPEKYHFRPRTLLSSFIDIYLNLGKSPAFVEAVATDGRSYKPATFEKALRILSGKSLKSQEELDAFRTLTHKFAEAKEAAEQAELDLGDVPADFEDPIMGILMRDPVTLPSRHIVDRSTIVQHLLSDPSDPYSRQPMTINDVVPDDELRGRIDAWVEERTALAKQKLVADVLERMDTTEG